MEPEQNTIGKRVDTHAVVMKELAEIRCARDLTQSVHSVAQIHGVSQMRRRNPLRRVAASAHSAYLVCLASLAALTRREQAHTNSHAPIMVCQGGKPGGTRAISSLLSIPPTYAVTPPPPVKMNRSLVEKASSRGGGFSRRPPNDSQGESFSTSSEDRDGSFRKRQAGLLDSEGMGLSVLKIGDKIGDGDGEGRGGDGGSGSGRGVGRRGSSILVTSEELQVSFCFFYCCC